MTRHALGLVLHRSSCDAASLRKSHRVHPVRVVAHATAASHTTRAPFAPGKELRHSLSAVNETRRAPDANSRFRLHNASR